MSSRLSSKLSSRQSSKQAFLQNSITNSNVLLKIFCCLIISVLICITIGHYAFKNGILTCDHYVFNTYLYIMLAITLMFLLILLNDKYGFFNSLLEIMFNNGMGIMIISVIIIIILMIVLTHAIATVNPTNILASNSIWLCLIILTSLLLIPIIYLGRMTDVIGLAGILTVVIVIIVGLLGYYLGDKIITFDWDYYLHIALLILVVIIILGIFLIKTPEAMIKFIYIISIISLIIFVLLLLSNHKKLKDNSTKCIDGQVVPNYPLESWNIFLKIIIIFKNLIRILAIRKGKFRK